MVIRRDGPETGNSKIYEEELREQEKDRERERRREEEYAARAARSADEQNAGTGAADNEAAETEAATIEESDA